MKVVMEKRERVCTIHVKTESRTSFDKFGDTIEVSTDVPREEVK